MLEKGILLPGETEEKCCYCFPLRVGMWLIIFLMFLQSTSFIYYGIDDSRSGGQVLSIAFYVSSISFFYSLYRYLQWFKNDCSETRMGLSISCYVMMVPSVLQLFFFIIYIIF